mgnify:FL=1|jgi:hypothetical protein
MANNDGIEAVGCLVVLLPILLAVLLFVYGVFVIVMRNAFGIDLPNPLDWLPPDWAEFLRGG